MLNWALTFLIVALIAAVFGFGGIAADAAWIAQSLFVVFLVLFLISTFAGVVFRENRLDSNIAKWRQAGGIGILFPQPWNQNHPFIGDKLGHVLEQLRIIADEGGCTTPESWVALCGAARAGKDTAGAALIEDGHKRVCFGDIIKRQVDALVTTHCGFSAFTDDDERKARIRPLLEHWGDVNYDAILAEFFGSIPARAVNTRLVRLREAEEWKRRGGRIIEVTRPGYGPASQWEADNLDALRASGLIDAEVINDGSIQGLHDALRQVVSEVEAVA